MEVNHQLNENFRCSVQFSIHTAILQCWDITTDTMYHFGTIQEIEYYSHFVRFACH